VQISVIAKGLALNTLQGLMIQNQAVIVPTVKGKLLRISLTGKQEQIVDFVPSGMGIPFGIAIAGTDLIVTLSDFVPMHSLVRVKPDGTLVKITDLSDASGDSGAPFGVTAYRDQFFVSHTRDVLEDEGQLLRVQTTGEVTRFVGLEGGNPFGIAVQDQSFVVAMSKGKLLHVSLKGEISTIADLKEKNFGVPFQVAVQGKDLFVTTNSGLVVRVNEKGEVSAIANILEAKYGIPGGIAIANKTLIVATDSGYLLKVSGI
jgi:hypothetical protein